ncbi:protein FAR1-RELATED SEQUENCE 5-like [Durio zibethinus]|uniref:Protein FAR1-RELATED SEQUENCE 5-like n=1 Tax=Durio zibethinus TaxID=66656 RepID=A0A6P5X4G7_DURZI|nr:protein FAR1-RELATED SEQUENCE 5-like [Durio zibethinus]
MDEQVDDVDGRLEASTGDESNMHDNETIREPYVGMIFESEEDAKTFYDDYARQVGFFTRVLSSHKSERDGLLFSRGLGCRGYPGDQTKVQLQKQDKQRENCSAMIHLRRDKAGGWVIKKFVRDHNHPLVIQLDENGRTLDEEKDKKIQELTAELRVKKRLSASYREQLVAFMKEVEDHNFNISMKVQRTLDNLKKLDAEAKELLHGR